jgi:hypothetical protein
MLIRALRLAGICAGLALFVAAPAGAHPGSASIPPILYVGDSLGVGTFPQLRSMMAGVSLAGDTKVGRNSTAGLSVLRSKLRRRHGIVIFDLGTNDYSAATLGTNLRRARTLTGDRLMIVFTMNKPGVAPFNRAVKAFARSADNVVLIRWHSTAGKEHLLAGDGIHAGASGYRRRAALVSHQIG